MKNNKILAAAVAAVFGASVVQADIALTDNLTLSGFIDGSYNHNDSDNNAWDSENFGIDHVEVDLSFGGEVFSAELHLDDNSTGDIRLEQAYGVYNLGNGLSISGGRMNNTLGFEADEAPDLYQNSYAYSSLGGRNTLNGAYSDGARVSYASDAFSISLSGYDKLWAANRNSTDDIDFAYEAQLAFTGVENLVVAVGYGEDDNSMGNATLAEAFNVWAQYEQGQFKVAAEYSDVEDGNMAKGDAWLILGNYAFSEKGSITLRYSELDWDASSVADEEKFTVSPGYAITDNLWGLLEYSNGEIGGVDYDYFAVETTFTF